mgnify:CR=1 FL=1
MRSNVNLILYDTEFDTVTMPREVYAEMVAFCRQHGETDLPNFTPAPAPTPEEVVADIDKHTRGGFTLLDKIPPSASRW